MSQRTGSILTFILIIGVFFAITLVFKGNTMQLDFDDHTLTVSGSQEFCYSVPYSSIQEIALIDTPAGTCIDGDETNKYIWGQWSSSELGEYQICANPQINQCILITTSSNQLFVFNYQNADTTSSVFDMFTQLLEHYDG